MMEMVKIGEIFRYKKGIKPKFLIEDCIENGVPYLTAKYFRENNPETYTKKASGNKFVQANEDDVILIWDGSNAGDVFKGLSGALASTMVKFEKSDKILDDFLFFFLKTKFSILNSKTTGSTIPHVSKNILDNLEIPFYSISEQHQITYVLNKVLKAIKQQDKLIRTTIELKKALMQKLFTEGMEGEKQKQTEIGLVPESWEVQPFENTGEVVYGIQAAVANNLKPVGHKILTNKNITLEGRFDLEKINYFVLTSRRHFDTILRKGDLLFNWRSGSKEHVGKTAIFHLEDGQYVHSSFILRIRVNENHSAKFLFYYLNYLREIGYYQKVQTFSINAKFNKSAINAMPIALPKRQVQDEIAETIAILDKQIDHLNAKYNLQSDLFKTLLHELMTGQRRVNEIDFESSMSMAVEH